MTAKDSGKSAATTCRSGLAVELGAPGTPGSVESGEYRNLFAELGHSEAEIRSKVEHCFQQLFFGNPKKHAVYCVVPESPNEDGPLAQIRDVGNEDVRSEGMSYGMMIAVQMDRKAEFDALWNWAKTYMYHDDPNHPTYKYFSWHTCFEGKQLDPMPAPDGEEYFAMALYFASGRWGNGEGIYNYRAEGDKLLDAMKNRGDIIGSTGTAVSLFNRERHQVRFSPNKNHISSHGDHTDPSYHLPAFYELWAKWGPESDRTFWAQCAKESRELFIKAAHPETALTPEYSTFDGEPKPVSWDDGTVHFRCDAWRCAMNWSVDWAWFKVDSRERELSDRLQAFFRTQRRKRNLLQYPCQYSLDGKPLSHLGGHSSGLVAMNAVASLASSNGETEFVDALWHERVPDGRGRYYDGMLYLMALLHVCGQFRAYEPSGVENSDAPSQQGFE